MPITIRSERRRAVAGVDDLRRRGAREPCASADTPAVGGGAGAQDPRHAWGRLRPPALRRWRPSRQPRLGRHGHRERRRCAGPLRVGLDGASTRRCHNAASRGTTSTLHGAWASVPTISPTISAKLRRPRRRMMIRSALRARAHRRRSRGARRRERTRRSSATPASRLAAQPVQLGGASRSARSASSARRPRTRVARQRRDHRQRLAVTRSASARPARSAPMSNLVRSVASSGRVKRGRAAMLVPGPSAGPDSATTAKVAQTKSQRSLACLETDRDHRRQRRQRAAGEQRKSRSSWPGPQRCTCANQPQPVGVPLRFEVLERLVPHARAAHGERHLHLEEAPTCRPEPSTRATRLGAGIEPGCVAQLRRRLFGASLRGAARRSGCRCRSWHSPSP